MPFFHRKSEGEKHAEAEAQELQVQHSQEQAASLDSLKQGGLPLAAQRRLKELAKDKQYMFTSDLSTAEFLLTRHEGLHPLTQVMGSCFYHVGFSGVLMQNTYMSSSEMRTITQAYDNARNLALGRMREEAKIVGANAVIGVRLKRAEYEWGHDTIEYTAVGTAVHVEGAPPAEEPALTTLSGEDFWKLLQAGYGAVGVAAGNCVFYQVGWDGIYLNSIWTGGWANQEVSDFTRGVRSAREMAQRNLHSEAQMLGAEGVVGVEIEQRQREREVEMGNETTRTDIIFTFLAMGTAIAKLKHARPPTAVKFVKPLAGRGMSRPKSQSQLAEE